MNRRGTWERASPSPIHGAIPPDSKVSQDLRDAFWMRWVTAGFKNIIDCIKAFSETDLTDDIKKFEVPTLIIHDDDQIVPMAESAI